MQLEPSLCQRRARSRGARGFRRPSGAAVASLGHQALRRVRRRAVGRTRVRIEADDPVWELGPDHALGGTSWYGAQPREVRTRIGLHIVVSAMHLGAHFENVLTKGLLEFALCCCRSARPSFRYAYHEAIEESQHTLMFREFVNRSGLDPGRLRRVDISGSRRVVRMGRRFPELFFLFVLGGEDPIDYVQRTMLRSEREVHPLLRRMMQIHVTEEARHLCFARAYLRERVPAPRPRAPADPFDLGAARARFDGAAHARSGARRRPHLPDSSRGRSRGVRKKSRRTRAEVRQSLDKVRALCRDLT